LEYCHLESDRLFLDNVMLILLEVTRMRSRIS
jgi:hypothetical protein